MEVRMIHYTRFVSFWSITSGLWVLISALICAEGHVPFFAVNAALPVGS